MSSETSTTLGGEPEAGGVVISWLLVCTGRSSLLPERIVLARNHRLSCALPLERFGLGIVELAAVTVEEEVGSGGMMSRRSRRFALLREELGFGFSAVEVALGTACIASSSLVTRCCSGLEFCAFILILKPEIKASNLLLIQGT